jgi:hypothetical protein
MKQASRAKRDTIKKRRYSFLIRSQPPFDYAHGRLAMYYVGLDIHQRSTSVEILDCNGKLVKRGEWKLPGPQLADQLFLNEELRPLESRPPAAPAADVSAGIAAMRVPLRLNRLIAAGVQLQNPPVRFLF